MPNHNEGPIQPQTPNEQAAAQQPPPPVKQQMGSVVYNVEFNDSVLSTKTWSNARYDGCKTETQVINKHTRGDVSYGKSPAVQNYTRNIYLVDQIIPASGSNTLVPFTDFSYAMVTNYITVNEDDTISENKYDLSTEDTKEGFQRVFQKDFIPNTKCKIWILDEDIANTLKPEYDVYYSQGRLTKIASFSNLEQENSANGSDAGITSGRLIIVGEDITEPFCSFSIENNTMAPESWVGPYGNISTGSIVKKFFEATEESYQASTSNRYFITLTQGPLFAGRDPSISPTAILTGSIGTNLNFPIKAMTGSYIIPALSQLSTAEFYKTQHTNDIYYITTMEKYPLIKPYFDAAYGDRDEGLYYMGYFISRLNQDIPSVLINLSKAELPYGLVPGNLVGTIFQSLPGRGGPKCVVIPENLHPYIKDNIKFFLSRAGLYSSTQPLTINQENNQLS